MLTTTTHPRSSKLANKCSVVCEAPEFPKANVNKALLLCGQARPAHRSAVYMATHVVAQWGPAAAGLGLLLPLDSYGSNRDDLYGYREPTRYRSLDLGAPQQVVCGANTGPRPSLGQHSPSSELHSPRAVRSVRSRGSALLHLESEGEKW